MKRMIVLLSITALALVSGCSRGQTNNVTPASTGTVDQAFLVGRWSRSGDCSEVMEFRADGTVKAVDGSTDTTYSLSGNRITFIMGGAVPEAETITRTGDDMVTFSGSGRMTRCH